MRTILTSIFALALTTAAPGAEVVFTAKPTATKEGDRVKISFTVSASTDAEVAVLAADGRVVRHLAAGVLGGKNPPPEPLKAGLSQEIVWDGQDDFGKPVAGAARVRVRAGMGAKLGRMIGQDPYTFGDVDSIAAGEDGNLYILGFTGPAGQNQKTLRVFSAEGKFIRTILPFPADLPPGAMKEVGRWDEAAKTWRPRNLSNLNPEFFNVGTGSQRFQLLSVTKAGGVLLVGGGGKLCRLGLDGSVPEASLTLAGRTAWPSDKEWPSRDDIAEALTRHSGPVHYAMSPDGKRLYLSGPFPGNAPAQSKVPPGSVWHMALDGSGSKMTGFAVLPATAGGPWSKDGAQLHGPFGPVHGMAVDGKGNVYVCDRERNRVAVLDEAGKEIGEIPVKAPDQVHVHPRTGAIYVIRRFSTGYHAHSMVLEKFRDFSKGAAPVASFARFHRNNWPQLVVTTSGERTILWIAGAATDDAKFAPGEKPRKLLALEDRGAELAVMPIQYGPRAEAQADFARVAADPLREEIYVSNGVNLVYRYNGDTGEGGLLKKDGKVFHAPDLSVGYDGMLYVRSGEGFSGPLERYTRDLTPAPFSGTGTHKIYDIYGRYGIGYCEKGVGAGPDGKVYDCWMYGFGGTGFGGYFVSGWGPDGLPLKGKYLAELMKQSDVVWKNVKLPDAQKIDSAIIGPVPGDNGGLRVDLKGNIYLGMRLMPRGFAPPAGFGKDAAYANLTGSVFKFRPEGGAVLGIKDAQSKDAAAPRLETNRNGVTIEGGLAAYPGIAPFSGHGGNCVCRVSRFDLDRYGRLALPNVVTTSVTMVDNAGNQICEIGRYGNFDSQYVPPEAKDGKPIVATPDIPMCWPTGAGFTEKAVYVCDTYNRRVVRADLTWKAEETAEIK